MNTPSRIRSLACFALAIAAGCSTTRSAGGPRALARLDPALVERMDCPSIDLATSNPPVRDGELWKHEGRVEIAGEELDYRYYSSALTDEPAPFLLVLPILAGGESITDRVCRSLARRGIAAGSIERKWRLFRDCESIEDLEGKLIRVVRQHRAFVDWMAERPEIDSTRMGCFGLSIGGMLATVLTAVEPRLDCAIICLAGGDFSRLALEADEIKLERWVKERCAKDNITPEELQRQIREQFDFDPLTFAPALDSQRVLFVTARFDGVVPEHSRESLWRALGRPERIDVPFGHYTAIFALEWIVSRAAGFAVDRLDGTSAPSVHVASKR